MADKEALLLLRTLVGKYSPSGKEKAVGSELHHWLRSSSAFERVEVDAVGNVLAFTGNGPYFLLCGHMDTVPGRLPVSFTGNELRGRGAVDAKASLAAMCVAASESAGASVENVMFAGVVSEERDGRGIRQLLSRQRSFTGGVFGEPSGRGIVVGYRGRIGLEILARGRSAHASSAVLGSNAVERGMKSALELKEKLLTIGCAASITMAEGGIADNVIPDLCSVSFDVRVPPTLKVDEVIKLIQTSASDDISVKVSEITPPINVGRANPIFRAASESMREAGLEPRAVIKVGTSDMNTFYLNTGSPCVAYGPGDPSLSHTDAEVVTCADFLQSIGVYSAMIRKVAGSGR
jgi:LysW-gamma-L-lysine carboxypeptidase